jgi:hypothetical protein
MAAAATNHPRIALSLSPCLYHNPRAAREGADETIFELNSKKITFIEQQ